MRSITNALVATLTLGIAVIAAGDKSSQTGRDSGDPTALIELLRNGSDDETEAACEKLKELGKGNQAVAQALRDLFCDQKEIGSVRISAITLFSGIAGELLQPGEFADSSFTEFKKVAAARQAPLLVRCVALQEIEVIARLSADPDQAVPFLSGILCDKSEPVELRSHALGMLISGRRVNAAAVLRMLGNLAVDQSESADLRGVVVEMGAYFFLLNDIRDDWLLPQLLSIATDETEALRLRSKALWSCRTRLLAGANATDELQRRAATWARKMMLDRKHRKQLREDAAGLLIHLRGGGDEAVFDLIDVLKSDDLFLHEYVVVSLGEIGAAARPAISLLVVIAQNQGHSNSLREAATQALARISPEDVDPMP